MKKINIIQKGTDFDLIIKTSQYINNPYFIIYFTRNNLSLNRFGIAVPKKLGIAVIRNKIKRQFKNIIDHNTKNIAKAYDYVIILRRKVLDLEFSEIEAEFLKQIKKVDGDINEKN